jgi:hypothetical protein
MRITDVWGAFFLDYSDLGMLHIVHCVRWSGRTLRLVSAVDADGLRLAILWAGRKALITWETMAALLREAARLEQAGTA